MSVPALTRSRDLRPLLAACLLAGALVVAAAVAAGVELPDDAGIRIPLAYAGAAVHPAHGVLLLVAAAVVRLDARTTVASARLTVALSALVLIVALTSIGAALSLVPSEDGAELGIVGFAVARSAVAVLAAVAGVLALPEAVADPAREAPDGGLRGGDAVGEAEVDRFLRP